MAAAWWDDQHYYMKRALRVMVEQPVILQRSLLRQQLQQSLFWGPEQAPSTASCGAAVNRNDQNQQKAYLLMAWRT
jgi:hypothetical protein